MQLPLSFGHHVKAANRRSGKQEETTNLVHLELLN